MSAIETFEHEGVLVKIYPDEVRYECNGPRDWSNLGEMVCWHRGYDLGDRQPDSNERRALERGGLRLLERYLKFAKGATVVIPLGLLDHSGITMYAGGGAHWSDTAGWDSGTVGFIFDTPEGREECGTPPDRIEACLLDEIKVYDQYLTGDVYGYVCELGEEEDSCWGFYGIEDVTEEAKAAAEAVAREHAINQEPQDVAEVLAEMRSVAR